MKLFTIALLGATLALAGPVMAQDRDKDMSRDKPVMHHVVAHHSYKWNYKSEADEHQATEELNRQYRGVPSGDQR
jgi:hypothetical protein